MIRIRWWVLTTCVFLAVTSTALAQPPAKYTENPDRYSTWLERKAQGEWFVAVWQDPSAVFKENLDPETAGLLFRYLSLEEYEVKMKATWGNDALRGVLAKGLVKDAQWDPIFEAVLTIAAEEVEEAPRAMKAATLLLDAVETYINAYPAVAAPARDIFLKRLADSRNGVRFTAVRGLSLLPLNSDSKAVITELVKLIETKDDVLCAEVARALAKLGVREAVKPLMTRFLDMDSESDPSFDPPENGSLNQAKLAVAIAVGDLTGIDRGLRNPVTKADILSSYEELTKWWEESASGYE